MELTRREFMWKSDLIVAGVALSDFPIDLLTKKAHASSEYTYSFSHFVNNPNWVTGITLVNRNSGIANLNLKAHNTEGDIIAEEDFVLTSNASLSNKVDNLLNTEGPGSIIIKSDKPLTGQETFTALYGKYYGNMCSLPLNTENDTKIYFPHIASDKSWKTGIAFCNPNSLDALVRLTMFDTSGYEVGYNEVEIPRYSQAPAKFARDLFNNGVAIGKSGYVIGESDLPINGLEIFMHSQGGMAGLNAVLNKELSNTIYFPHFASSDYWWTGLGICNPTNEDAVVNFKVYSQEGNLNSEIQEIIKRNAQITKLVRNFPNLSAEGGWIEVISNQPIAGIEVFGRFDNYEIAGLNACFQPGKKLYFPKVVNKKSLYSLANPDTETGLAFVNPSNEPANINIKAYDNFGNPVDSKSIILNPHESKPQMSYELAPNLEEGHIELNSNENIIGLQLCFDNKGNMSGTLATRGITEPVVSSLEGILGGGIIAGAELSFYDKYKNYIDSVYTDAKGKFKIPDNASRVLIEKSGYYTLETNISSDGLFDLIPKSFDMNNFDTIFRGGKYNLGIQRWLKEQEGGQNPKWYIDINANQVDGYSSIPQSWINRAIGTIEDKLTQLPIEIVKNPYIKIGHNPPIHYQGSYKRPDKGWIWVKWKELSNAAGYHIEFGPNDADLNYNPGMNIVAATIGLEPNAKQTTFTQEFGQVLGARKDVPGTSTFNTVFKNKYGTPDNYTPFDKNAFEIDYKRLCGNDDFNDIRDYEPKN
ncbi:hypothetical protein KAT80_03430 [Candidatus Pacearchaeota archaeon]|nr:hypothetical protein [Candidatus Pacearchaeota archaeon]